MDVSHLDKLPPELIATILRHLSPATDHVSRVALIRTCKTIHRAAVTFGLPGPPRGKDLIRAAVNPTLHSLPLDRGLNWETGVRAGVGNTSTTVVELRDASVRLCCEMSLVEYCFLVWNEKVLIVLLHDHVAAVDPNGSTHSGNIQGPTFLQIAIEQRSQQVLEALLRHPSISVAAVEKAFILACSSGKRMRWSNSWM